SGRLLPVQVGTGGNYLTGIAAVAAGKAHTVALREDGTVWTWGRNLNGQLGDGSTSGRLLPVQVVVSREPLVYLDNVRAVAAGAEHTIALQNGGTVWAWGANANGRLGDGTTTQRLMAVQVVRTLNPLAYLQNVRVVAAGTAHTLALGTDGKIWAWGANGSGQLGDGSTGQRTTPVELSAINNVNFVAAGGDHSLALKNDETAWAWGNNSFGQLGIGSTTRQTVPRQVHGPAGGSPFLTGIIALAGGMLHTLAVEANGTLRAWGYNFHGQLGDGTTTARNLPVRANLPAPPQVVSATPGAGAANVGTEAAVFLVFNEGIREGPLFNGITMKDGEGNPLALNCGINGAELRLEPAVALAYSTAYTLTVPRWAVQGTPGNLLAADFTLAFTTKAAPDTTPPLITGTTPIDGAGNIPAAQSLTITVTFNEEIAAGPHFGEISLLDSAGSPLSLVKAAGRGMEENLLVIETAVNLLYQTTYRLTLPAASLQDKAGNHLAVSHVVSFTTKDAPSPTEPQPPPPVPPSPPDPAPELVPAPVPVPVPVPVPEPGAIPATDGNVAPESAPNPYSDDDANPYSNPGVEPDANARFGAAAGAVQTYPGILTPADTYIFLAPTAVQPALGQFLAEVNGKALLEAVDEAVRAEFKALALIVHGAGAAKGDAALENARNVGIEKAELIKLRIPVAPLRVLADAGLNFFIVTPLAKLEVAAGELGAYLNAGATAELIMTLAKEKERREQALLQALAQKIHPYCTFPAEPLRVSTSFDGAARIIFPFAAIPHFPRHDRKLHEQYLRRLQFFVRHNDGETALLDGAVHYNAAGEAAGMGAKVDRFSTFALLEARYQTVLQLQPASSVLLVNGRALSLDTPPFIQGKTGRVMAPFRLLVEALGGRINFLPREQKVLVQNVDGDRREILLHIGSAKAMVDGQERVLPDPVKLIKGRVFAPLRFIGDLMGAAVRWDGAGRSAVMKKGWID
ncbi:MAG TPA: hypothetical protein DCQ14_01405, partial [Firmicutes bacterium]|nr:hypothetical protein [Bacillota bacterium]